MKIGYYIALPDGGARRTSYEQIIRLRKRGHVVSVFEIKTPGKNQIKFKNISDSYKKVNIKKHTSKYFKRFFIDFGNLINSYYIQKKLAEYIDSKSLDLVLVNSDYFTQVPYLLRFLKTKSVYYCHELLRIVHETELDVPKDLPFLKYVYEILLRFIKKNIELSNSKNITSCCTSALNVAEKVRKVYHKKAFTSHPGVDYKIYRKRTKKNFNNVLYLGGRSLAKGYDFIKLLKPLLDGEDINLLTVKSFSSPKPSDVDIAKLYSRSLCTLCVAHNEPFGLIAIESFACETPVLAVNEGGFKESVENKKNGYLVKRNEKLFLEKMLYLKNHPKLVTRMGEYGRKAVLKYWNWDRHVDDFEKILKIIYEKN